MNKSTTLKVLLVDDEVLALNLLENFINRLSDLEIIGRVQSPVKALEILQQHSVDILFLDIQMPTLSGTNLLKALPKAPITIFTTAYSEHASLAFDLNAVDYLLKPFSFERFLQAIMKAKQQLKLYHPIAPTSVESSTQVQPQKTTPQLDTYITVKVDGSIQKIFLQDIIYVEGMREYIRIVCEYKHKYVVLESLKNMEQILPEEHFMRVHKSYIAAKAKATQLSGNMLEIGVFRIPTSRNKKEAIIKEIFG
ncbi:MAG: LytR/AlgR family response regulator transcription factor [Aureispira sp.]